MIRTTFLPAVAAALLIVGGAAMAQDAPAEAPAEASAEAPASWLPSLITETPEEGFALAVTMSRKGVTTTQTEREVLFALRPAYAHDPQALIQVSGVIATYFATIAAANDYWRD